MSDAPARVAAARAPASVRAFDLVVAVVGLVVTAPLWPVLALAVRLDSKGPVLFRGRRLAAGGGTFEILKFRTMTTAQAADAAGITVGGDARVTRVGRVLRRTKLDELPQLLNVVRGDMGIVGPRPEDPRYLDAFPDALVGVLAYPPGITSPASVEYRDEEAVLAAAADPYRHYVDEVLPAKARIDLDYFRRRTLRSDVGVVLATIRAVVR